jgi:hypothetical protein
MDEEKIIIASTPKERVSLNIDDIVLHTDRCKDTYLAIKDQKISIQEENTYTQYYSAESFLDDVHNKLESMESIYDKNIKIDDSFDTLNHENKEHYDIYDYDRMREYIENEDFVKLKDLQDKLLREEIDRRSEKNLKRVAKFAKLQDKMINLEKKNDIMILEEDNLVLSNIDKTKGYQVVPLDEVEKLFGQEQVFCGFKFYSV